MSVIPKQFLIELAKFSGKEFTQADIKAKIKAPKQTINNRIQWAVRSGLVIRVSQKKGGISKYRANSFCPDKVHATLIEKIRETARKNKEKSSWCNANLAAANRAKLLEREAVYKELKRIKQPFSLDEGFAFIQDKFPELNQKRFRYYVHIFIHYRWAKTDGNLYRLTR